MTTGADPLITDRPFLFFLRERLSGTVLFTGAFVDPPVK